MIAETSTQLQNSASYRECAYDSIFAKLMHIFENSEEYHNKEDDIDESMPSKQEGVSFLLQAILHF